MKVRPLRLIATDPPPGGWEELWSRDQWRGRELPHADLSGRRSQQVILHFEGLVQPWLKEAAKRWVRARVLSSTTPSTMSHYLDHLAAFSRWLAQRAPEVRTPVELTRELIEDYLLAVRTSELAGGTKWGRIGALRSLLAEQREDGLAGLPRSTNIYMGETPRPDYRLPKGIEAFVFDQFIDPENLARLPNEQHRTVIMLLALTGVRVSSLLELGRDALQIGSDKHPYLLYVNAKHKREAALPIGPVLCEQLRRQEEYLQSIYGKDGTALMLPSPPPGKCPSGRGGAHPITEGMVRQIVKGYVRKAEIRDSKGALARWVHPHLFRHHLGTHLVNEKVPLRVIQKVLDHDSVEMTAHYAHVNDTTVQEALTGWHERVNVRGERIALPAEGPLAQAAWMKDRIAQAKQALPNGFCGLPLQQTCPHPNACLSCDHFLTDPSFREVHKRQLDHTRRMREDAERGSRLRLVEVLQHDEQALARILTGLEQLEAEAAERPEAIGDVRDLAEGES
jgi:site-specific recombinase XerD